MYGEIGIGMILAGVLLDIGESMLSQQKIARTIKTVTIFLMWGGLAFLLV